MSAHENLEHVEHAEHASHGGNKKIALLISVLALFLAFSETLGKSSQTAAITYNVTTNDLWAFYQAKHIRGTILRTAAEQLQLAADRATDADAKGRLQKVADGWKKQPTATTTTPRARKGASSWPNAPRNPRKSANWRWRAITITNSLQPLSKSASSWLRRR